MIASIRRVLSAAIAALWLFGASSAALAQQPMILPVDPAPLVADTGTEKKPFQVEIADDETERARGLMFRENMAPDRGMLFVYPSEQPVAFWMQNTILPLDLIFIDAKGKVVAIEHGTPYSQASIPQNGTSAQFVLELNAGTAKKIGLDVGETVHHPAIGNALPN